MANENRDLNQIVPAVTGGEATNVATSVIFMVPDGFGDVAADAYELYRGREPVWESFFLVVEAAGTDIWAHANDAASVMRGGRVRERRAGGAGLCR